MRSYILPFTALPLALAQSQSSSVAPQSSSSSTSTSTAPSSSASPTSGNGTCSPLRFDIDAPVNASATYLIPDSRGWYLSVTLNDTRTAQSADHSITGWLSTPRDTTARACMYQVQVLLPETSPEDNGDCAAAGLSQACLDFWKQQLTLRGSSGGNGVNEDSQRCPNVPLGADVREACGGGLFDSFGAASTTRPWNLNNATCTQDRVPSSHPNNASIIPDDYVNRWPFSVSGFAREESDKQNPQEFTWYEKYVKQSNLWIVAEEDGGQSTTHLVCLAPRDVAETSRPVEQQSESAAGLMGVGLLTWTAVIVASVMVAM